MPTTRIHVDGMTCQNCVRHVTEAIAEVDGVTSVSVDLDSATASVETDGVLDLAVLTAAVEDAGYNIRG
ncbi:MAG: heavy-metal-associated domain-containing protein [Ilumatobacteraceae bacterium]